MMHALEHCNKVDKSIRIGSKRDEVRRQPLKRPMSIVGQTANSERAVGGHKAEGVEANLGRQPGVNARIEVGRHVFPALAMHCRYSLFIGRLPRVRQMSCPWARYFASS